MRYVVPLLVLMLVPGCKSAAEPADDATVGVIVARTVNVYDFPSIHVKASSSDPCGCIYSLRSNTTIRRRTQNGTLTPATYDDLLVGKRVQLWGQCPLLSCPGQGGVDMIELLP